MATSLPPGAAKPPKALMLAYVFPPFFSVGGSIRIVKFIKYLPSMGWLPVILTIDDRREYDTQRREGSESLLKDVPEAVKIYRTTTGEPTVEFLEKGRKLRRQNRLAGVFINLARNLRRWAGNNLLLPDAKVTWLPFAVKMGLKIVKEEQIDLLFVTCPPHSALLSGVLLKWLTRKPLVVDYRDDWIDTPWFRTKSPFIRWVERSLERLVIRSADRVVLVTEWSKRAFEQRYPRQPREKFILIPNGCDLQDYQSLRDLPQPIPSRRFTIVHAGLLSVAEDWHRSPEPFFQAIRNLREQDHSLAESLKVIFTGHLPEEYQQLVKTMELEDVVEEAGFLQRPDFMKLLSSADLLLTINYEEFSTLVPGKIYDYWAIGRPPILLLSCAGAAQELVQLHQLGVTVPPNDVSAIQKAILDVHACKENGNPLQLRLSGIENYDRMNLSRKMAGLFTEVLNKHGGMRAHSGDR